MILAGLIAARFTHYLALMLLFGAATFAVFAAPEIDAAPSGGAATARSRLRRAMAWGGVSTLVTALLVLALTAANMAGALSGMIDVATLRTIALETDFGRVWVFRIAVAAALTAWLAARLSDRRTPLEDCALEDWAVILAAGAVTTTVALTGHAQVETGPAGLIHRIGDAVHLVAAAVWLGALPPFLLLLRRASGPDVDEAVRAGRLLERFHRVGMTAVAALIVSGLINSWFLVGGVGALFTTPYGRLLLVKLALLAAMVAFAADNRLRLVPRLNRALAQGLPPQGSLKRLRRHVRSEFILGLGVLLAVAVLGAIAPAAEAGGL